MLDILEKLINFIEEQYIYTNSLWIHTDKYVPINLKRNKLIIFMMKKIMLL